jgi:hypothetical protein
MTADEIRQMSCDNTLGADQKIFCEIAAQLAELNATLKTFTPETLAICKCMNRFSSRSGKTVGGITHCNRCGKLWDESDALALAKGSL